MPSATQRAAAGTGHAVTFRVAGLPPAKSEALSVLGARHPHAARVVALLDAAREVLATEGCKLFASALLGLEVVLRCPNDPPSDATNYLGGIADALEDKSRRGALNHLEELASVALYDNDRQIREVHFRHEPGAPADYTVRLWVLS
jgi:hypothetical protein